MCRSCRCIVLVLSVVACSNKPALPLAAGNGGSGGSGSKAGTAGSGGLRQAKRNPSLLVEYLYRALFKGVACGGPEGVASSRGWRCRRAGGLAAAAGLTKSDDQYGLPIKAPWAQVDGVYVDRAPLRSVGGIPSTEGVARLERGCWPRAGKVEAGLVHGFSVSSSEPQPANSKRPPIGVMIPSFRLPVRVSA